ncbi:hypothetical protein ACFWHR_11290 [Leucobacter sp. NPDC058333]|uniref:hypothetical protein n=1 Tax=Leucobacter sp. NPDC058333 TaxID=3346450 RepID=UPI003646066A
MTSLGPTLIDFVPAIFALTHAVVGLTAILSLAKIGPQLSWPKMIAWIFFIAAIPLVGAIVWFTAGRRGYRSAAADDSKIDPAPTQ